MIIDAHQHVWDLERNDYPWLGPELAPINRTITLAELRPELKAAGVDATVLVQSADSDGDTDAMLEVAHASPEVVGVVVWVPLDEPALASSRLAELRHDPLVVGVRALIHDMQDPAWILRPEVSEGLSILESHDVPFDYVTADPAAVGLLPELSARHPRLRIVLDHLGKPPIGGARAELTDWRDTLAVAAQNPLLHAKVSGLYSSVGPPDSWDAAEVRAVISDALSIFGADRLMYGGDWPMSLMAGGYSRVWEAFTSAVEELPDSDRARLLGGTAAEFYRLGTAPLQ